MADEKVAAVLSFDEVFPEDRPHFDLKDGSQLPFRVAQDFDSEEFGELMRLEKLINGSLKAIEKDNEDQEALKRLGTHARDFVKLILPDIEAVMVGKMTLGQKMTIVNFWRKEAGFDSETEKKDSGDRSKNT